MGTDHPRPPCSQRGALGHHRHRSGPRKGARICGVSSGSLCWAPRCGALGSAPCEEVGLSPVDASMMKFQENSETAPPPPLAHPFPHIHPYWPFLPQISRRLGGRASLVPLSPLDPDHLLYPGIASWVRSGKHETVTKHGLWRPSMATSTVTLAGYFISLGLSVPI